MPGTFNDRILSNDDHGISDFDINTQEENHEDGKEVCNNDNLKNDCQNTSKEFKLNNKSEKSDGLERRKTDNNILINNFLGLLTKSKNLPRSKPDMPDKNKIMPDSDYTNEAQIKEVNEVENGKNILNASNDDILDKSSIQNNLYSESKDGNEEGIHFKDNEGQHNDNEECLKDNVGKKEGKEHDEDGTKNEDEMDMDGIKDDEDEGDQNEGHKNFQCESEHDGEDCESDHENNKGQEDEEGKKDKEEDKDEEQDDGGIKEKDKMHEDDIKDVDKVDECVTKDDENNQNEGHKNHEYRSEVLCELNNESDESCDISDNEQNHPESVDKSEEYCQHEGSDEREENYCDEDEESGHQNGEADQYCNQYHEYDQFEAASVSESLETEDVKGENDPVNLPEVNSLLVLSPTDTSHQLEDQKRENIENHEQVPQIKDLRAEVNTAVWYDLPDSEDNGMTFNPQFFDDFDDEIDDHISDDPWNMNPNENKMKSSLENPWVADNDNSNVLFKSSFTDQFSETLYFEKGSEMFVDKFNLLEIVNEIIDLLLDAVSDQTSDWKRSESLHRTSGDEEEAEDQTNPRQGSEPIRLDPDFYDDFDDDIEAQNDPWNLEPKPLRFQENTNSGLFESADTWYTNDDHRPKASAEEAVENPINDIMDFIIERVFEVHEKSMIDPFTDKNSINLSMQELNDLDEDFENFEFRNNAFKQHSSIIYYGLPADEANQQEDKAIFSFPYWDSGLSTSKEFYENSPKNLNIKFDAKNESKVKIGNNFNTDPENIAVAEIEKSEKPEKPSKSKSFGQRLKKSLSFKNSKKAIQKFFGNTDGKAKKGNVVDKSNSNWYYDSEYFPDEARDKQSVNRRRFSDTDNIKNPSKKPTDKKFSTLGKSFKLTSFLETNSFSPSLPAHFPQHAPTSDNIRIKLGQSTFYLLSDADDEVPIENRSFSDQNQEPPPCDGFELKPLETHEYLSDAGSDCVDSGIPDHFCCDDSTEFCPEGDDDNLTESELYSVPSSFQSSSASVSEDSDTDYYSIASDFLDDLRTTSIKFSRSLDDLTMLRHKKKKFSVSNEFIDKSGPLEFTSVGHDQNLDDTHLSSSNPHLSNNYNENTPPKKSSWKKLKNIFKSSARVTEPDIPADSYLQKNNYLNHNPIFIASPEEELQEVTGLPNHPNQFSRQNLGT